VKPSVRGFFAIRDSRVEAMIDHVTAGVLVHDDGLTHSDRHDRPRSNGENVTTPNDPQEEIRKDALTAFLGARVREGFRIETRIDTHAIIVPADRRWSFLDRLRKAKAPARQVVSVDEHGEVRQRVSRH
jgi:hypothetical protein